VSGVENLIRVDCSEFALAHEYSKLIGSPPGYVGHEEGGQLTRALTRNPGAVVLFDEIEKAHPRMHNILLQVLEEGSLTDGCGRRVSLEQNFVLMTSNAGADEIRSATSTVGFHRTPELGDTTLLRITQKALELEFSPEFLGRLDQVILFSELDLAAARCIAQDQLTDLALRARRRGTRVAFTPAVARWVAERGFSPQFGARELRNVIQREVEPRLARLLLDGRLGPDCLVRARIRDGELQFHVVD
jgi:ATP-dependent Clp protease ATP-binding subunit ClpC